MATSDRENGVRIWTKAPWTNLRALLERERDGLHFIGGVVSRRVPLEVELPSGSPKADDVADKVTRWLTRHGYRFKVRRKKVRQ